MDAARVRGEGRLYPGDRRPDGPHMGEEVISSAEARERILTTWAKGPCVILVTGVPGTGKTALLEELATRLRTKGQNVHYTRRGDRAAIPGGAAVLLVDEAARMPDLILRSVLEKQGLFCVLAAPPEFAARVRSLGFDPEHMRLSPDPATTAPHVPQSRRRRAARAAAAFAAVASLAAVLMFVFRATGLVEPSGSSRLVQPPAPAANAPASPAPSSGEQAAGEQAAAPVSEPARTTPAPAERHEDVSVPAPATPPNPPAIQEPSNPPVLSPGQPPTSTAAGFASSALAPPSESGLKEPTLPAGAIVTVSIVYPAWDHAAAASARSIAEYLRKAGTTVSEPTGLYRRDRSAIRYFFTQDRGAAETLRSQGNGVLLGLPLLLTTGGPAVRPGHLQVVLGWPSARSEQSGNDALARERRPAVQEFGTR